MKTYDVRQGSSEWLAVRRGKVTASEADELLTPLFKIRTGDGPRTYLYRKVAEKLVGFTEENAASFHMQNGTILERECIPWLAFEHDMNISRVGFVSTDDETAGYSPDGLIDDDGILEIKSPSVPVQTKYLIEGIAPTVYLPQIHFGLWVTGRAYCTFVSYSRHLPKLIVRVERDEKIQAIISEAMAQFTIDFEKAVKKLTIMREEENVSRAAFHAQQSS